MPTIDSIQVGKVVTQGDPQSNDIVDRQWTTAFDKQPVAGLVRVRTLGLAGDSVADTQSHGGIDKAILCYASSHYDRWAEEYPDLKMSGGAMGENLTIDGVSELDVCIGDVYQVGSSVLQVSQPRQPCWKISRRWGDKTLLKAVTQTGRTGWYVRVLQEGDVRVGAQWKLQERPNENWSIARAADIMFGRESDQMAFFELMNLPELADAWKAELG
ncbi:MOSC domain-containing protein [Stieleria marina]|uniref:6-N-hydroxylaminopurine resistance protein n=1 Tax=Stieleria marina TaxID=1930275 RepID=A0A517P2D8_9BACT|nr:6-N-hydroxylaminopurine resistance protein [Planctomycetes bacterium K23_9]